MAKKSSTYKRTKKAPKWQLPLLLVLVLVAVGFGVFIVFFSRANTNSPQVYLTTNNNSAANAATNIGGSGGFTYGDPGDKILACDWDGTGGATVAAYRPSNSSFYISNTNASGNSSITPFQFGIANSSDYPICGTWSFGAKATVGIFRDGTFYLATSNAQNASTLAPINNIGAQAGDIPLACDWNGDGRTDLGYYRPSNSNFYMAFDYNGWKTFRNFQYGPTNNLTRYPICGNWDGSGLDNANFSYDTVGFYDTTNGTFYLRNTNTVSTDLGTGATVTKFADQNTLKLAPVVGRFTTGPTTFIGGYTITEKPAPAPAPATTTSTAPAPSTTSAAINGGSEAECATKTLRRGNTGTCLSYLISILRSKGYNVAQSELDSLTFGPDTESKVRAFQTAAGIGNDGVVGPITWGKLTSTGSGAGSPTGDGFMEGAAGGTLTPTQIICQVITSDITKSIDSYKTQRSLFDTQWPVSADYSAWRKTERARFVNGINALQNDLAYLSGCTQSAQTINNIFTDASSTRNTLDSIANTMRAIIYPKSSVY